MLTRFLKYISVVVLLLISFSSANAQNSYQNSRNNVYQQQDRGFITIPSERNIDNQERDLPDWLKFNGHGSKSSSNPTVAHITTEEVTNWTQEVASDALTLSYKNYRERIKSFKKYFVPAGKEQYLKYLKDTKLIARLKKDKYTMRSVVSGKVFIVNQGSVSGAYRWLVEVPLIISFFRESLDGKLRSDVAASGKIKLLMQVGRVSSGGGDLGIAIERWKIKKDIRNPSGKRVLR